MSKKEDLEASDVSNIKTEKSRKDKKRKHRDVAQEDAENDLAIAKLSKEERREKKRLKKEKREKKEREARNKEIEGAAEATASDVLKIPSDDKVAKKAAKEARKAEKKRLKALKELENGSEGNDSPQTVIKPDSKSLDDAENQKGYVEEASLRALPQSKVDEFLSQQHITITDAGSLAHLRPILEFSQLPSVSSLQPSPFRSFKNPTPIQSASWPFLLSGRDVIGVAETGSGKTLAFGVPCIRHIAGLESTNRKGGAARAVIVSPTRELAVQIHEQVERLAKSAGLEAVCVYGGVPKDGQRAALRTAHIVVATPGRLNDLIDERSADLSNVSYVVLDEADRMLDKGFEQEIRKIISSTLPTAPQGASIRISGGTSGATRFRQTLMFTATWPPSVRQLAATFMSEPVRINIGEDNPTGELRANARIKQVVEVIDPRGKEQRLLQLIKQYQSGKQSKDRILVFCLYKKEAQRTENFLRQRGLSVAGIHGDLSQDKRTRSLESFKTGETPLLVATDVAARGLDIPNVKVVLNVTFPLTAEDYVHRIGRTGRAGADGLAITLFTEHDKAQSGALINVLKAANQPVPDELLKFGTTVKKKQHDAYGAFYKEDTGKKAEKIKFDD